jgi:hypothetical protein
MSPKKEELYERENGRFHLIEDQSYVDLENNEVFLDYQHQIDRFENEEVDKILNMKHKKSEYVYKNFLKEDVSDISETLQIVNYKFFKYINPSEFENIIEDMSYGNRGSFNFFNLENGDELVKIKFTHCVDKECFSENNMYDIFAVCLDNVYCEGRIFKSINKKQIKSNFYINNEDKLFISNLLDKNGKRLKIHNPFVE